MEKLNTMIANYLDWKLCDCGIGKPHYKYGELNWQTFEIASMDFHKNWNSLMPVLTKIVCEKFEDGENVYLRTFGMINSENGKIMVRFNRHICHEAETLLEATYEAVCDFIMGKSASAKTER